MRGKATMTKGGVGEARRGEEKLLGGVCRHRTEAIQGAGDPQRALQFQRASCQCDGFPKRVAQSQCVHQCYHQLEL